MLFKKILCSFFAALLFQFALADQIINLYSPNGQVQLVLTSRDNGDLVYNVLYKGKAVVAPSALGFRFKAPDVSLRSFDLVSSDSSVTDETWNPVWGEQSSIRNNYKQLALQL